MAQGALNFTAGFAQKLYELGCTGKQYLQDHSAEVKSVLHTTLDVVSMVPMVGSVASGINTALYIAEGDYSNAALSAVSMVPGVGINRGRVFVQLLRPT